MLLSSSGEEKAEEVEGVGWLIILFCLQLRREVVDSLQSEMEVQFPVPQSCDSLGVFLPRPGDCVRSRVVVVEELQELKRCWGWGMTDRWVEVNVSSFQLKKKKR